MHLKSRAARVLAAELRDSFSMALAALAAHKLRSALTLLGVLVGVFSIIVVMTAMRVLQRKIEGELSQFGSQTFVVQKNPGVYFGGREGYEKFWRRKNITLQQALAVKEKATLAANVGFELYLWRGEVVSPFDKTTPDTPLMGGSPGIFPAKNLVVAEGRALLEADLDSTRDVVVLGHRLARTLFPFGSSLGQRVKFNGINYTVVGVLEPKGAMEGNEQDNVAIIPMTTGINRYGRFWQSLSILVQARDPARYSDTVEQVRGIMRVIRKVEPGQEDDFEVFSSNSMIEQFNSFTQIVRWGIAAVSSIALLAAGIGIMNIMLVSVTERTREIGIRRAVGAKKRNIMAQFILEAIVLCQFGGAAGVVLGVLGGNSLAYFMQVPPAIPVDWVLIGFFICSLVGLIFGTYPAFKAANLDPIESLRYE